MCVFNQIVNYTNEVMNNMCEQNFFFVVFQSQLVYFANSVCIKQKIHSGHGKNTISSPWQYPFFFFSQGFSVPFFSLSSPSYFNFFHFFGIQSLSIS